MTRGRPILVTGAHRTGTTWVGRMIASAPGVRYIHEPFNPKAYDPGVCRARFGYEFPYVCRENEAPYVEPLRECHAHEYGLSGAWRESRSLKRRLRALRGAVRASWSRSQRHRPLLKDPHALFSAAWLADTFDLEVVLLARHPAAFVGSLKHANWAFRFEQFLEQPLLMRDHLNPFAQEIEALARQPGTLVDQGILLWRVFHTVLLRYREERPDWIHVRHEDLSRDPIGGFESLFAALALPWTRAVARRIEATSRAHHRGEEPRWNSIRRDSLANLWTWKTRLTEAEIDQVRTETHDIAVSLYGDMDWEP